MIAAGRELVEPWPVHPDLPAHGAVLRRDVLDEALRDRVRAAGASVLMGHEALAPVVERGFVRGALLADGRRRTRDPFALRRRRRRREQPVRAGARHHPRTRLAVRHRHPELLEQPPHERHVDGDAPRHSRRQRQSDRRVRMDRSGRRRHGQRRRRAAVVVPRRARGERAQVARRLRPADRRRVADQPRRPAEVADPLPGAARRFGRPDDGPDVPRRRRRRRRRQPVQRRRRERRVDDRPTRRRGA